MTVATGLAVAVMAGFLAAAAAAQTPWHPPEPQNREGACAEVIEMEGAFAYEGLDVLAVAPAGDSLYRFCFYNHPMSDPAHFEVTLDGWRDVFATIRIGGPPGYGSSEAVNFSEDEFVLLDGLPGHIITDLEYVPIPEIRVHDDAETHGYIFLGIM